MQRHGAFRRQQVLHDGADTHPAVGQPNHAGLVYPPVFNLYHLAVLVKVVAVCVGLRHARTVQRDQPATRC